MIGGLPLGDALCERRIANGMCFFCTMETKDSRHWFISFTITRVIWKFINVVWMSFSSIATTPFKWMFAQVGLDGLLPCYYIVLKYLIYRGLCYVWQMQEVFVFDYKVMLLASKVFSYDNLFCSQVRQLTQKHSHVCQLIG